MQGNLSLMAETSGVEKNKGRRGCGYENFPSNKLCVTVPKHSVTVPFCGFLTFLIAKVVKVERGWYHDFLSEVFCLTAAQFFQEDPRGVSLISGNEKFDA